LPSNDIRSMNPLITVIIPTIGRPDKAKPGTLIASPYLRDAISSVVSQDYQPIELLISDNNPASGTRAVVEQMRDERIRLIERPQRLVSGEHFTACIQDARGEFVMVLSDDDLLGHRYLSSLYGAFARDAQVRVGLGYQIIIGEKGGLSTDADIPETLDIYDGVSFMTSRLWKTGTLPIMTYVSLLARRTDILRCGGFPPYPDGSNADNFIMFSLAMLGKVAVSSRVMYYRVYDSSFGLRAPFENLVLSCAQYERDLLALLEREHGRLRRMARISLPPLVRLRNVTMMGRRLLTHYRGRLGPGEFVANWGRLMAYAAVGRCLETRPRVWLPS
jgi:glycosyltransferase involved in cell wall biosynthesis